MTIRNIDRFVESIQDWAILDGCFGKTRIRPSDIDGFVERRGTCLFLEGKGLDAPLTQGQAIGYLTLARQGNTVIVFWGKGKAIARMRVITRGDPGVVQPATLNDLRRAVATWYQNANRSSAKPGKPSPQNGNAASPSPAANSPSRQ